MDEHIIGHLGDLDSTVHSKIVSCCWTAEHAGSLTDCHCCAISVPVSVWSGDDYMCWTTHHAQLTKLVHADVPGVGSSEQHPPAKDKLRQTLKILVADSVRGLFAGPHESEQMIKMGVCAGKAIDTCRPPLFVRSLVKSSIT